MSKKAFANARSPRRQTPWMRLPEATRKIVSGAFGSISYQRRMKFTRLWNCASDEERALFAPMLVEITARWNDSSYRRFSPDMARMVAIFKKIADSSQFNEPQRQFARVSAERFGASYKRRQKFDKEFSGAVITASFFPSAPFRPDEWDEDIEQDRHGKPRWVRTKPDGHGGLKRRAEKFRPSAW